MTNYHDIWGPAQRRWSRVDIRGDNTLTILTVCAWIGMILFFVFLAFLLLTKSDAATITMWLTLAVWLACGISAIRIRRKRRRFLRVMT